MHYITEPPVMSQYAKAKPRKLNECLPCTISFKYTFFCSDWLLEPSLVLLSQLQRCYECVKCRPWDVSNAFSQKVIEWFDISLDQWLLLHYFNIVIWSVIQILSKTTLNHLDSPNPICNCFNQGCQFSSVYLTQPVTCVFFKSLPHLICCAPTVTESCLSLHTDVYVYIRIEPDGHHNATMGFKSLKIFISRLFSQVQSYVLCWFSFTSTITHYETAHIQEWFGPPSIRSFCHIPRLR